MGEVWAAASPDGTREVAIKVLLPNAAMKPEIVARFEREARVTASIESQYVCKLLGHARDPSGAHLLVFEKLIGETMSERLKRELYLPFAEVGPLVDDAFQGLAAAHAAGVIHRDLKPGNIFIEWTSEPERPERAKVLDFGISKLTKKEKGRRDEPSLTDFDATLGSFAYMAPEQVRGAARVDERADIYAMGAVAFRALAGRLPVRGKQRGHDHRAQARPTGANPLRGHGRPMAGRPGTFFGVCPATRSRKSLHHRGRGAGGVATDHAERSDAP